MENREKKEPLLKVENLTVSFSRYDRGWNKFDLEVIHSLDAEVFAGEILAVVGSSGSGKSLLAHSILGILPGNARVSGCMEYRGSELTPQRQKALRGEKIVFIPQSVDFLDPLMKVGKQVKGVRGTVEKMKRVFHRYRLNGEVEEMYPFQLSGGMARRALIAAALMESPDLIIADEPTTALDAVTQYEVMEEFVRIRERLQTAMIFISHDFGVISRIADRILVMNQGQVEEEGTKAEIFCQAQQPYTRYLIGTRAALMAKYREAVYGESGRELIACAVQTE